MVLAPTVGALCGVNQHPDGRSLSLHVSLCNLAFPVKKRHLVEEDCPGQEQALRLLQLETPASIRWRSCLMFPTLAPEASRPPTSNPARLKQLPPLCSWLPEGANPSPAPAIILSSLWNELLYSPGLLNDLPRGPTFKVHLENSNQFRPGWKDLIPPAPQDTSVPCEP